MNLLISEAHSAIDLALEENTAACITCSFQAEGMVTLHLLREHRPEVPVLFLDTGYHFAEVYRYRDQMKARYNLNLVNLLPPQTVAQQESQFGILHQTRPDQCCELRKVRPLFTALENYDVWFTGLRRAQSATRANLQIADRFTLPSGKQLLKVSPLAHWSSKDVWTFARQHELPLLPLYQEGYTSIGCQPCTMPPTDPADARSGRWAGQKVECGIHISAAR